MIRTYKYLLYPTDTQIRRLDRIVEICRHWYNMCLAERKYVYESDGVSIGLYDQLKNVKRYKDTFTHKGELHSHILQVTTADADKAYQAFFRRVKDGSNSRKKKLLAAQRQYEHVSNQRSDFLHKLSSNLVQRYDRIAVEDLSISNMVRNKRLAKHILDSGWGIFKSYLSYKAESAGKIVAFVDPAYTSKSCSSCGAIFENLKLSDRWVECDCGLSLDRDHNAAINILNRVGRDTSVLHNVTIRAIEATGF